MNRARLLFSTLAALTLLAGGCSDDGTGTVDGGTKSDGPGKGGDGAPAGGAVVATGRGPVKGTLAAKTRAFLGIPYAQPPQGKLRWAAPLAAKAWTKTLAANKLSDYCHQPNLGLNPPPGKASEDCLKLNVWTPHPVPPKPAPVMVWIHGGAFTSGSGSIKSYDGKKMAQRTGAVVVTINYRLGVLGFLTHKKLGAKNANLGLQDQQAALGWVKRNIKAFGGDPNNVTIFGESAGSVSVCLHLVSPASKGLFKRAIMQSGPCSATLPSLSAGNTQGDKLSKAVKCDAAADELACLRGKGATDLVNALKPKSGVIFGEGDSWGPVIDGALLPNLPQKLVQSGAFNKASVLLGTNRDEGTLFVALAKLTGVSDALYKLTLSSIFGNNATKVLLRYPVVSYKSAGAALADLMGDVAFVCPNRRTARALAAAGVKTYLYEFVRNPSYNQQPFLGCYHGAEIPFVFQNPLSSFTADEDKLSRAMQDYWTRFGKAGDPNGAGAATWPAYAKSSDEHLKLDLVIAKAKALKKAKCDFWDSITLTTP